MNRLFFTYSKLILLSMLILDAYAGPTYFNTRTGTAASIYHAFDRPFISDTVSGNKYALLNNSIKFEKDYGINPKPILGILEEIKSRGYTHIQTSPIQDSKSSSDSNIWWVTYQPVLWQFHNTVDSVKAYARDITYALSRSDGKTKDEATAAASSITLQTQDNIDAIISKYCVQLSDKRIVGYRIGNDRYGSLRDLSDLIQAVKEKGLEGLIVDVVFNHICDSQISYYDGGDKLPNDSNGRPFFHNNSGGEDTQWFGGALPDLNTSNSDVQTMLAGYLSLLNDIGIVGVRFDAAKAINGVDWEGIFTKAKNKNTGIAKLTFGYGEVWAADDTTIGKYKTILPLADFKMCYETVEPYFANNSSVGNAIPGRGIQGYLSVCFSANHDQYPGITTGGVSPLYWRQHSVYGTSTGNIPECYQNSQLAIAYLLAKKDKAVLVLNFDDERDDRDWSWQNPANGHKRLIKNALQFRGKMKDSPEYLMAAPYTNDVIIIARQKGFAIINRGKWDYKFSRDVWSIINNTYKSAMNPDCFPINKTCQYNSYERSSGSTLIKELKIDNIFSLTDFIMPPKYAVFFIDKSLSAVSPSKVAQPIMNLGTNKLTEPIDVAGSIDATNSIEALDLSDPLQPAESTAQLLSTEPVQTAKFDVDFSLTINSQELFGYNFYLTGDAEELGYWDVHKAVEMSRERDTNHYTLLVSLTSPFINYKYIAKNGSSVIWLSGKNLSLPGVSENLKGSALGGGNFYLKYIWN